SEPMTEDQDEVTFAAPAADSPLTTATLLERYGIDVDDEHEDAVDRVETPCEPVATAVDAGAAEPEADDDHEQSVEQYMARLLAENNGHSTQPTTPSEVAPAQPTPEPQPTPVVEETKPQPEEPITAAEMKPRHAAPEEVSGLAAMRELANLNTSSNLGKHTRKHSRGMAIDKAEVAFLSALCGSLTIYWSNGQMHLQALGGAAIAAACWWGGQALTMAIRSAKAAKQNSTESSDVADRYSSDN
ncbi:MAG: hypothetical protein MI757_08810, partial [Pirellulales bacterium]|nr:hypothetical protein [Pirellulales bacterium]